MHKETEIKLRVSRETLAALREHPLLKKRNKSGWESRELLNQYFDTPERDLAKAKVALRLRRDGEDVIQTLKTRGESVAGLSVRNEYDWNLPKAKLDIKKLDGECWPQELAELDKKTLKPIFTTDFVRERAEISWGRGKAAPMSERTTPELILHRGLFTTLDKSKPSASAVAIQNGKFVKVGNDSEVMALAAHDTRIIDLRGRRVLPGLIDNHLHIIRGGLNYNLELRWEGVPSLADALRMLKAQAARTPTPQWVRVVGGWNEFQFAEKRMPTLDELNQAAPDTPVFVLHLYDRALLNRAALRVAGYTRDTPNPPGGEIVRDANGNPTGMLVARPNAMILYSTLAKGPTLALEYQVNSTRQFMRELNRLGLTSAIDAGGGFQNYPDDYRVIEQLAKDRQLTIRIAYNLFTQKPKEELTDFKHWTSSVKLHQGDDFLRHNGAGEMLVFSAADFEDFLEPRPDLPQTMEDELEPVVRHLVEQRWPFRLHATYNEHLAVAADATDRDAAEVDAMVAFFAADQQRLARLALGAPIGPRHLQRGVRRLRSRAGEEHVVQSGGRQLLEPVGQGERQRVPVLEGGRIIEGGDRRQPQDVRTGRAGRPPAAHPAEKERVLARIAGAWRGTRGRTA